jgi:hypothetical protein
MNYSVNLCQETGINFAVIGDKFCLSKKVLKFFPKLFVCKGYTPTFASPFEKWDFQVCLSELESNYSRTITIW